MRRGKFELLVAPLEGYSERAFRALCFNHGASKTFTEMARVDALAKNNRSTWNRITLDESTPTVIQLLPTTTDHLKRFLDIWHKTGYKNIEWNLNLGCPSPHLINKGLGCAMMKRINKINEHVSILQSTNLPVSLKFRLGLNEKEAQHKVYINVLKETNADYYIIHARNGKQTAQDKPDWSIFKECSLLNIERVSQGLPEKIIIANGDIRTIQDLKHFEGIGVHGVMLGRVAVQNPSIFNQFKNALEGRNLVEDSPNDSRKQQQQQQTIEGIRQQYKTLLSQYYGSTALSDPTSIVSRYESNFTRHFANPKYSDIQFQSG